MIAGAAARYKKRPVTAPSASSSGTGAQKSNKKQQNQKEKENGSSDWRRKSTTSIVSKMPGLAGAFSAARRSAQESAAAQRKSSNTNQPAIQPPPSVADKVDKLQRALDKMASTLSLQMGIPPKTSGAVNGTGCSNILEHHHHYGAACSLPNGTGALVATGGGSNSRRQSPPTAENGGGTNNQLQPMQQPNIPRGSPGMQCGRVEPGSMATLGLPGAPRSLLEIRRSSTPTIAALAAANFSLVPQQPPPSPAAIAAQGQQQQHQQQQPMNTNCLSPQQQQQTSRRPSSATAAMAERKRSGSAPDIQITLATAWNLKPGHVRALKTTWGRLCDTPHSTCPGILTIMERVFSKLELKERTLRDVFYRSAFVDSMVDCAVWPRALQSTGALRSKMDPPIATLRDHIHFLISLLAQVINALDQSPEHIFDHIDKIGCYHARMESFGFNAAMWDTLGVCLLDQIVQQDCVRGFPEGSRAWTIAAANLVDRLRSAPKKMEAEIHRILRRQSNQSLQGTMIPTQPQQHSNNNDVYVGSCPVQNNTTCGGGGYGNIGGGVDCPVVMAAATAKDSTGSSRRNTCCPNASNNNNNNDSSSSSARGGEPMEGTQPSSKKRTGSQSQTLPRKASHVSLNSYNPAYYGGGGGPVYTQQPQKQYQHQPLPTPMNGGYNEGVGGGKRTLPPLFYHAGDGGGFIYSGTAPPASARYQQQQQEGGGTLLTKRCSEVFLPGLHHQPQEQHQYQHYNYQNGPTGPTNAPNGTTIYQQQQQRQQHRNAGGVGLGRGAAAIASGSVEVLTAAVAHGLLPGRRVLYGGYAAPSYPTPPFPKHFRGRRGDSSDSTEETDLIGDDDVQGGGIGSNESGRRRTFYGDFVPWTKRDSH